MILPIYWNSRVDEKQRVVSAAQAAQQVLNSVGVISSIDDGDKYTPGQKMKHW